MSEGSSEPRQIVELLTDLDGPAREAWWREHPEALPLRARVERVLANVDRLVADAEALPDLVGSARQGPRDEPLPETIGPYRVLERLGAGGMGIVYLAEQVEPRRRVAVKVLRDGVFTEEADQRFRREAELLGRLQHPGVAQVVELGRLPDGPTYLVLEAIDGVPITVHAREADLDQAARIGLLVDLADAVHHAHLRGVVHRDLKPSNVLVTAEGQVKVIDFGVARALDEGRTLLTRAGQLIGTLAYMSPEQVGGEPDLVDARADVYALGVMAYELLGGRLPLEVDGTSVAHAARVISEVDPPNLGRVATSCRGDLEIVIGKALEKRPGQRYASAAAFGADLDRVLRHEAILARRPTLTYQLGRLARRHRAVFATAGLALVSLVAATIVAWRFADANHDLALSEAAARREADDRADEARRAAEEADRQRLEVERLARLAAERSAEIIRRADPARLLLARSEAGELWPALPSRVPAMEAWLTRYEEMFRQNLPQHREALEALRAGALPYTEAQHRQDQEGHPLAAELAVARSERDRTVSTLAGENEQFGSLDAEQRDMMERALVERRARVADLEQRLERRLSWTFEDPEIQEQHDHLAALVADLTAFLDPEGGLAARVRRRRERALSIEARSVTDPEPAAAWRRARDDIARSPRYGGLDLAPQVGLLPLLRDQHSGLWEFWLVDSGERPTRREDDGGWVVEKDTGLVFVLVPGGATTVGAQATDPDAAHYDPAAQPGEGPVREVELPPLFVSKYELTQEQWARETGQRPSQYQLTAWYGSPPRDEAYSMGDDTNPVEMVSLEDCQVVLARMGLRVPAGGEWEHAARGGTDTPWWTGADLASLQGAANVADGRVQRLGGPPQWTYDTVLEDDWIVHAPVGRFAANPFGLHDVLGNVFEWTVDEPQQGIAVARGGCFEYPGAGARVTFREYGQRQGQSRFVGVRPVRDVDGR